MPFDGSGTYTPPTPPDFPAVDATTIEADNYNNVVLDIAAALSQCMTKNGESTATGDFPMGGKKLLNVGGITRDPASVTLTEGGPSWTLYSSPNLDIVDISAYPPGYYLAVILASPLYWQVPFSLLKETPIASFSAIVEQTSGFYQVSDTVVVETTFVGGVLTGAFCSCSDGAIKKIYRLT